MNKDIRVDQLTPSEKQKLNKLAEYPKASEIKVKESSIRTMPEIRTDGCKK